MSTDEKSQPPADLTTPPAYLTTPPAYLTTPPANMTAPPPAYNMAIDPSMHPKAMEAYSTHAAIVQQPQPVTVTTYPFNTKPDISGPIVFSCVVLFCCCCPLGLAAFILAVMAGSAPPEMATYRIRISNYLNIAGVVVGILFITLRIVLSMCSE